MNFGKDNVDKVGILFPNSLFDKHLMAEKVASTTWVSLQTGDTWYNKVFVVPSVPRLITTFGSRQILPECKYSPKCAIFPIWWCGKRVSRNYLNQGFMSWLSNFCRINPGNWRSLQLVQRLHQGLLLFTLSLYNGSLGESLTRQKCLCKCSLSPPTSNESKLITV